MFAWPLPLLYARQLATMVAASGFPLSEIGNRQGDEFILVSM
ncbi:MAG: hypothetical protein V9G20_28325 [Candidatus Promineifilaceae bacterium]